MPDKEGEDGEALRADSSQGTSIAVVLNNCLLIEEMVGCFLR